MHLLSQISDKSSTIQNITFFSADPNYNIKSIIPTKFPFTFFRSVKIFIKDINDKEIEVEILKPRKEKYCSVKTKLSKVRGNLKNPEFLFYNDFSSYFNDSN